MKKQILTLALFSMLLAGSTSAFEIGAKEVIQKALGLTPQETPAPLENGVQVQNQVTAEITNTAAKTVENETPALLGEKVLTPEEVFFEKIKNATTEEGRKAIFTEFKNQVQEQKGETLEVMEDKSSLIFSNFDTFIAKLDEIKLNLDKTILKLKEKNVNIEVLEEKINNLNAFLDLAKEEKATAWIKMQEVNFFEDKEKIKESLGVIEGHLNLSKEEIKKASTISKEIIYFIRGVLVNTGE